MDLQYILTVNLMVISALAIVSVLMHMPWRDNLLWLAVNTLVIVAGLAGMHWLPDWAALPTAAIFIPFVLAPIAATTLSRRSVMLNKPERAAVLARLAAILHPADRTRFNAATLRALAAPTQAARVNALLDLKSGYLKTGASADQAAQLDVLAARHADDWRGVLTLVRRLPVHSTDMVGLEIRALGELGQIDEMARSYDAAREHLLASDGADVQLFVLAFGGKTNAVEILLERAGGSFDADTRRYWTAIARRAAGEPEETWRPTFEALARSGEHDLLRSRASAKLAEPATPASADLTPAGARIIELALMRFERYRPAKPRTGFWAAPVTYSLLAALVAMHAWLTWKVSGMKPLPGDQHYLRALLDLGALWPPAVMERGEWWRLLTATFLHFGTLHLAANSLMLYMLGRPCEDGFGWWRMLILYIGGGLASSGFVQALWRFDVTEPAVLVGASGAIMAVFGGLVGLRLLSWLRHRDVLDRRFLTMVPVILAIQFAVDLSTPQVSFAAHVSGFFAGLVLGLALAMTLRRREA